ncbi:hypothetical protein D3C80_1633810 [compost metagenome]
MLCGAFKKPSAASRENSVSAEQIRCAIECYMAQGMSGNRDCGEFLAVNFDGFAIMNDVVGSLVGSFLRPIDF